MLSRVQGNGASIIRGVNRDCRGFLLPAEQNARMVLAIAARAYVVETGKIALSGPWAALR